MFNSFIHQKVTFQTFGFLLLFLFLMMGSAASGLRFQGGEVDLQLKTVFEFL